MGEWKPPAVIFDLDGVLADISDRMHYFTMPDGRQWEPGIKHRYDVISGDPYCMSCGAFGPNEDPNAPCSWRPDYDEFNNAPAAKPLPSIELAKLFHRACHDVIILTGRPGKFEQETRRWLREHGVPYHTLIMRSDNDQRSDPDMKLDVYLKYIEPFYNVRFAVEDRAKCVKMWRDLGLTCLQAAESPY